MIEIFAGIVTAIVGLGGFILLMVCPLAIIGLVMLTVFGGLMKAVIGK